MIKSIVLYDNQVLRKQSRDIDVPETLKQGKQGEVKKLVDDLFETMYRADGIGLAAIQAGIDLRVFVAGIEDRFRDAFINPRILESGKKTVHYTEGCLSIPRVNALVERPDTIVLEYYDEQLQRQEKEFSGMESRVIQHELDHLDGVLFIDHLDKMWEVMMADQLKAVKEGKVVPNYPYIR